VTRSGASRAFDGQVHWRRFVYRPSKSAMAEPLLDLSRALKRGDPKAILAAANKGEASDDA